MKKLIPLLFILLIFTTCKKENFNFSRLNGVNFEAEYGLPVINTDYSIEKMLTYWVNNDYIVTDPNGKLFLNYRFEQKSIINDSLILSLPDANYNFIWNRQFSRGTRIALDTIISFKIPSKDLIIKWGEILHGALTIEISNNVGITSLTCSNIKDKQGQEFYREFSGVFSESIDLQGYKFTFTDLQDTNTLKFDVGVVIPANSPTNYLYFNAHFISENIRIKNFVGQIKRYETDYYTYQYTAELFKRKKIGYDLTLYNTKATLNLTNSFQYISGQVQIDTLHFVAPNTISDILSHYPMMININPNVYTIPLSGLEQIHLSSDYNTLSFRGKAIVNPQGFAAGDVSINYNSIFKVGAELSFPFDVKVAKFYYFDTIAFNLNSGINLPDLVESAELVYHFGNKLPLAVDVQAYFYNSTTYQITDSLFDTHLLLNGCYNDNALQERRGKIEIGNLRITNLANADKIILALKINTGGNQVSFNVQQYIKAILGIKTKIKGQISFNQE
ncbi:MAG: hypothetical protein LBU51_05300 [Bacteroidales bacterium]|jgi:hypothetical protein|nr:hypothetical protein [Bacteroidales bacterium]